MHKFESTRERRALAKARAEARAVQRRKDYELTQRVCVRLGKRLRAVREARGLSRYALAQAAGMSREMVGKVEGGVSAPTVIVLMKVAKVFRTPLPLLVTVLCEFRRR